MLQQKTEEALRKSKRHVVERDYSFLGMLCNSATLRLM